ncbi:MAG: M50 family metallopeptidase [Deltaproteobacteria bacterium]|nr:M50 family metallopeptidase [Deltaproteobacteria bacterium]
MAKPAASRPASRIDWKVLGTIGAMFALVLFFWDWSFLYPIKLFVVLLHETGHGLAAVLTGGSIDHIEISSNLGGVCWSRGGWRLLVLPAGYLGSMFFGGLILIVSARTRHDRYISMVLGALVVVLTLWFVRNAFGFAFGLLFGVAMVAAGKFLSERFNDVLLKFLGLTSSLYAIIDIKEDLISRTVPGSDAYAMSQELFLPPVFWGVLWIALALIASSWFVWIAVTTRLPAAGPGSSPASSPAP